MGEGQVVSWRQEKRMAEKETLAYESSNVEAGGKKWQNREVADWMVTVLLIILFLGTSTKALLKGVETWKKETIIKKGIRELFISSPKLKGIEITEVHQQVSVLECVFAVVVGIVRDENEVRSSFVQSFFLVPRIWHNGGEEEEGLINEHAYIIQNDALLRFGTDDRLKEVMMPPSGSLVKTGKRMGKYQSRTYETVVFTSWTWEFSSTINLEWRLDLSLCGFVVFLVYMVTTFALHVPDWSSVFHSEGDVNDGKRFTARCDTRGGLGHACNAVGYVDRQVWGVNHLYNQPVWIRKKDCTYSSPKTGPLRVDAPAWCLGPFEPEGLLSSISSILSGTISVHYGHVLIHFQVTQQLWTHFDSQKSLLA